jgi:hypothetical protein
MQQSTPIKSRDKLVDLFVESIADIWPVFCRHQEILFLKTDHFG